MRRRQGLGVALLPRRQQLHQHLAMGLHRHAVERLLRTFQSLPLRAESRVTQTRWRICSISARRAPVIKSPAKTPVITGRASRARPSCTRTAWRTSALARAIPRAPCAASGGRGLALLARAVIAPARDHYRPRCGWWWWCRSRRSRLGGGIGRVGWGYVRRRRKHRL